MESNDCFNHIKRIETDPVCFSKHNFWNTAVVQKINAVYTFT